MKRFRIGVISLLILTSFLACCSNGRTAGSAGAAVTAGTAGTAGIAGTSGTSGTAGIASSAWAAVTARAEKATWTAGEAVPAASAGIESNPDGRWSVRMAESEMVRNPQMWTVDFVTEKKWNY